MEEEQDLGDWDQEFLEAAIKAEELHLSSSQLPPPPQQQSNLTRGSHLLSYSPPRELSQRSAADRSSSSGGGDGASYLLNRRSAAAAALSSSTPRRGSDNAKDLEIQRLKKELGRVSKQLTDLENECSELKKERNGERRTKTLLCENEGQDANINSLKRGNVPAAVNDGVSRELQFTQSSEDQQAKLSCKATGVQAELSSHFDLLQKLSYVWDSSSNQNFGREMISKLYTACSTDFHFLFLEYHKHSSEVSEAAKVSHLYSVTTKISNRMIHLEALVEALLDLCRVKNGVAVHRSLRILHVLLRHLFDLEKKSDARNTVAVEEHSSENSSEFHRPENKGVTGSSSGAFACASHISFQPRFDAGILCKKNQCNTADAQPVCHVNWVSLFKLMNQIAMRTAEEHVKLEAVSIMNVIVMRSSAYSDREKFGSPLVFESISLLLRKEAGIYVRKEVVHLLYLVLNCPKLLAIFDSYCKEREASAAANDNVENPLSFKTFCMILEGLADCIASYGNGIEDLELCRGVIKVLAFLASSGKYGFEVLARHKLSKDMNFLMLIMQLFVSEIDVEAAMPTESVETFKARTLLMREILIFLNRLVSNPSSSSIILQELTQTRDMASLTVHAASRLSCKRQVLEQADSVTGLMRECEITDLARIFKKRVFAFLGDNI